MATELCTACGCGIVNNRTPAGPAVRHSAKLYCAECAALILSPEDLARLSKPAIVGTATAARGAGSNSKLKAVAASLSDEAVGEDEPDESASAGSSRRMTAQPGLRPPSRRDTSTAGVARSARGKRSGTSVVAKRDSSVVEARDKARGHKAETPRARQRAANNNLMYIVMGVAGLALCLVAYFVFLRDTHTGKKPVAATWEDSDKTTSTEYARHADDYAAKNDTINAVAMLRKAADKAEKEKNFDQARIYSMRIPTMEKAATVNSLNGGK
jgi:hypothetical protein